VNDFLRNLRSSHKKDSSDPRRNLDGHYYPKEDRRQILDRRIDSPENSNVLLAALLDYLPKIADNSTQILIDFKKLVHNNDVMTQARLKQTEAVCQFFDNLNTLFSKDLSGFSKHSEDEDYPPSADYIVGNNFTKKDILELIKNMRKEGHTFAVIADVLTEKKIPTFSGRGQWHAQTIHRLCK